jgi:hypothetical protein
MFMTKNREMLMELKAQVETLKTALIVMDPKVSTSADAYEGLRKQVVMAASDRRDRLVLLSQFSRALRRGATIDQLGDLTEQWMQTRALIARGEARWIPLAGEAADELASTQRSDTTEEALA